MRTAPPSRSATDRSSSGYALRLAAYVGRLARRAARSAAPRLRARSVETAVVCEGEAGVFPPPVTLPGHVERVSGTVTGDVPEAIGYATSLKVYHGPTTLHRIPHVVYDNGHLYRGLVAEHVSSLGWPTRRASRRVAAMCLCSSPSGSRFFGDWLLADTLLELLAHQLEFPVLKARPHTEYPHLPDLNALLGLSDPYSEEVLAIDDLWVVDDAGYNEGKRRRLRALRTRARRGVAPRDPAERVYLGRGAGYGASRRLTNEPEIVERLRALGFVCVDPERETPRAILERITGCAVVVGVEGSHLSYGLLALREGGLLMTLQPPYRFQPSFRPRCVAVGVDWGFVVGRRDGAGFEIAPDELEQALRPYVSA